MGAESTQRIRQDCELVVPSPPNWGKPLESSDYAELEKSWIDRNFADAAMLRRVAGQEARDIVGQKGNRDCAGILIPYYWPGDVSAFNYRIRRDNPEWTAGKDGKLKPQAKYLGPPKGANRLYIPPGVTPEQLADPKIPIVLVEGEKKALALWRLANYETELPRFIPIAIAGVWNWRGTTGKMDGPKGERLDVKGPIPDLSRIPWANRSVFIVFDVNVHTNDSVKWARKGIDRELTTRGAKVQFVNLPEDCGVNGIDDLLALWGPERVLALFDKPVPGSRIEVKLAPQFQLRPEGIFRVVAKGDQITEMQLANYRASIISSLLFDDGVETSREFQIEAELLGRTMQFTVSAQNFSAMDWPIEQMGPAAITYPRQKDYTRTAIQAHSMAASESRIYTHTGWREIDGRHVFLHAGGAIGADGAVHGVEIRLPAQLRHFRLCLPSSQEELVTAVRASLRFPHNTIGFPLRAATLRSVFGGADFSVHLCGETGAFKTELASLEQRFFGADMDSRHLPASWSSTANSIEILAFHLKDGIFVVDDFAPQGSANEVSRLNASADRVFRNAANHSARSRLDSQARLREQKVPRSLILSTGEDVPNGESLRARLLILDVARGEIDPGRLTECQNAAREGLYATAMGAFIRWIAGQYAQLRELFKKKTAEYRARALGNTAHARTPDILASLQAAVEIYLQFADDQGAIERDVRESLAAECWEKLGAVAAKQAAHLESEEPAARYLQLLRAAFVSGQAHLVRREDGGKPESAQNCGWHRVGGDLEPKGACVGWVDGGDIYVEQTAAYGVVQIMARTTGSGLAITLSTLNRRLHARKMLASVESGRETLTVRRSVLGSTKKVLHFRRDTIFPPSVADPEGGPG